MKGMLKRRSEEWMGRTYAVIDDILAASIIVDVDGHPAQSRDFGRKGGELRFVLPVGFGVRAVGMGLDFRGAWREGY